MLAADVARFGGANQDLLWHAFAQRGFGQIATTTSNNDTDPMPDFSSPLANNATLTFTRRRRRRERAAGQREHLRRRLPGPRDADRGHRPGDDRREQDDTAQFVPTDTGDEAALRARTTSSPTHRATATCAS